MWNNRILRHKNTWTDKNGKKHVKTYYAVHEVFYDDKGKGTSWTEEPIDIGGDTVAEVIGRAETILKDIQKSKKDIIDYDKPKE